MSKARAKGTEGENFFLPRLRRIFGEQVERAPLKGVLDYGDYTGVPVLCESKNTVKPLFQQWARKCEKKAGSRWAIFWKGDLRTHSGTGPYVLLPYDHYEEMALSYFATPAERAAHRALYRVDI
jgi:hypothetical protein